jgi:hypothetical protein
MGTPHNEVRVYRIHMSNTVVGLFDSKEASYRALRDLSSAGFQDHQISVVTHEGYGSNANGGVGLLEYLTHAGSIKHIASCCVLSGHIADLVSANEAGGPMGALVALGVPSVCAQFYCEGVRRGASLVVVTTGSDIDAGRTETIMDKNGAVDIDARAAYYRSEGFYTHEADSDTFAVVPGAMSTRVRRYAYADYPAASLAGVK